MPSTTRQPHPQGPTRRPGAPGRTKAHLTLLPGVPAPDDDPARAGKPQTAVPKWKQRLAGEPKPATAQPKPVAPKTRTRATAPAVPPALRVPERQLHKRRQRTVWTPAEPPLELGPPKPSRIAALNHPLASYYLVVATVLALATVGLVMVLSASSVVSYAQSGNSYAYFERQLLGAGIGLAAAAVTSRLKVSTLRWTAYPLLTVAILGLTAVLVPGIGLGTDGATRWIQAGPFTFQPSEFAKLALIIWGADLLARKHKLLHVPRHLFLPLLPVFLMIATLVMLEPDMGTTLTIVAILLALLIQAGAPMRLFAALFTVIAVATTLLAVLEPYRLQRLLWFTHPFDNPTGAGYQMVQGIYALASGGPFGLGLGASREKWSYLPHAHTDYIFAIIGEELGLFGTCLVIALFVILALTGLRVARRNTSRFVQLGAVAVTAWLTAQAFINMGAVVGILPVTGIPLPFISYGSSALVPNLIAAGLLAAFARHEPAAQALRAQETFDRQPRKLRLRRAA